MGEPNKQKSKCSGKWFQGGEKEKLRFWELSLKDLALPTYLLTKASANMPKEKYASILFSDFPGKFVYFPVAKIALWHKLDSSWKKN